MSKAVPIIVIAGIFLLVLLTPTTVTASSIYDVTDWLIPQFEGFRATPYWDVSRYSWGYGTAAPGSTGSISEPDALAAMRAVVQQNYNILYPLITRDLTANQWGALLSFAYEEGTGNTSKGAIALVNDINSGDDTKLEAHWKEYVYAGGVYSSDIAARRDAEWQVWAS